jgi:hypothetical protein
MKVKSTHQFSDRRRQRGQTVLWFLATIAACCCVFALVYNVGQVTNHKEATVNAADAAALSGALVEARMLNFEAYTNRAMIANEVTIAQIVSLDSWVRYDNEMMQWIATYTAIVPYLNDVTQAIADVSQIVQNAVDAFAEFTVPGLEGLNTVLGLARDGANLAGAIAADEVARKVADANATTFGGRYDEKPKVVESFDLKVTAINAFSPVETINGLNWMIFTDAYAGDKRTNGKNVILNSRDPFTNHRDEGYLIKALNVGLEAAGLVSTAGLQYFGLEKTSGTTTMQHFDDWAGQDSLDLTSTSLQFCFVVIPCGYKTDVIKAGPPLAYGRADAASGGVGDDLCWVSPSTTNCRLAVKNSNTGISWSGMPNIRDVAENLRKTDSCSKFNGSDSPSLSYVAAVQKKGDATLTTPRAAMGMDVDVPGPQGSPLVDDNLQNGDNLTSIAEACTFFLRPDLKDSNNKADVTGSVLARADGVHEYASLYNPYWQARLTTPDTAWTTALYTMIGHPALNAFTP